MNTGNYTIIQKKQLRIGEAIRSIEILIDGCSFIIEARFDYNNDRLPRKDESKWSLYGKKQDVGSIYYSYNGRHNILNGLTVDGAIKVAVQAVKDGYDPEIIYKKYFSDN